MAVTSRFSSNANLTSHTQLQISDNTAETKVLKEIEYYSALPTIPTAVSTPDTNNFLDRGSLQAVELGDDQVDFPEFTIEIDLTVADITGTAAGESDWFNIMNNFVSPADGTTALTTTNSGTVNVKNGLDPTSATVGLTSMSIPSDIDTLRLEILFTNGSEVFGFKWEQVQPLGVEFGGDATATMTLKFKVLCAPVPMQALTTAS